ncbi:hypothetical protein [Yeosuana marina]|uniref:lipopolysaccharide biosynthesis protein n=1 Tax=Yeosuana marina TaxID=1565536 RepID=UPI0030C80E7C
MFNNNRKGINTDSRTANSFRNVSSGLSSQIVYTILGFVSRTIFIKYLAVEYLGINGLFSSILSVLALAELGVGSAFVYSLYKPLAEKKEDVVASILNLYKKVYITVGFVVFVLGICLLPFLDQLIPQKPDNISESISTIYLLFLFNSASSYFFSYKVSLINADQRNYISTWNYLIFYIVQNILQIVVLILYQNFLFYLTVQLVCQFLSNVSISFIVNKYYPFLSQYKKLKVDNAIKKEIISNAKATFIIRIGGILVNSTDNLIINYFSGLALVGLASNYNLLIGIATAIILQIFNNISSSIAQINAVESKIKQYETFKMINLANFWIYGFTAICFILLANDFIAIWIGNSYILPMSISLMIAINFFMVGVQGTIWTYKATYGFFNQGKYLVILTALLNLAFSFLLGHYWGLFGILLATALARLITNFWYDPYIIFKLGLAIPPKIYLKSFFKFLLVLIFTGFITFKVTLLLNFSNLINLIVKLVICLIIPNLMIYLYYKKTNEFESMKFIFINSFKSILQKFQK